MTDMAVVLDLDQTLVATQEEVSDLADLKILSDPRYYNLRRRIYHLETKDYDFWGIVRPHTYQFLAFCFSYFKTVIVWSAGKYDYVHALVDFLFRDFPRPDLILTYDDTVVLKDNTIIKPLSLVYEMTDEADYSNTIAIDDNPTTMMENPDNAILIPEYEPYPNLRSIAEEDLTLVELIEYFLSIRKSTVDVREIPKSIFFEE